MTKFLAKLKTGGGLDFGSEYNRARFLEFARVNDGMRVAIDPVTPESKNLRNFLEGAVLPLATYYQETMDHHDWEDVRRVREWLKTEFNWEYVHIAGHSKRVTKSTKGKKVLREFTDKVIDWMRDQGYQTEVLDPEKYKHWKDTVYPYRGPTEYIDYLLEKRDLK